MEGPNGEKIDEEVEVDDEEFNRGKKDDEANSKASTKEKNGLEIGEKLEKGQKKLSMYKTKQCVFEDEKQKKVQKTNGDNKISKIKKRRNREKSHANIYQKNKPINKTRGTKNSLKTGVISLEQLKKLKSESIQAESIEN